MNKNWSFRSFMLVVCLVLVAMAIPMKSVSAADACVDYYRNLKSFQENKTAYIATFLDWTRQMNNMEVCGESEDPSEICNDLKKAKEKVEVRVDCLRRALKLPINYTDRDLRRIGYEIRK